MSAASTLPAQALQASRAALSAALADQSNSTTADEDLEAGEIQEVDMQAQAEGIRTVFSDPSNFNVKVRNRKFSRMFVFSFLLIAPSVFPLDSLVRLTRDKRSQSATDTCVSLSSDPHPADSRCSCCPGMDGRYQACDQL